MEEYAQFEYRIETLAMGPELCEDRLNVLGKHGWELVSIDFDIRRYYFKRKIKSIC